MKEFSQAVLNYLDNKYYVYALVDPRHAGCVFYIGKGINNRVFQHERDNSQLETEKLNRIREIEASGREVEKHIIQCHLTEEEAFAAESALINLMNLGRSYKVLTNVVSGHRTLNEAIKVETLEIEQGAETIYQKDIKDNLLAIKINTLYRRGMSQDEIYNAVRGYWHIAESKLDNIDYVLAVYRGLVVGVFKPEAWASVSSLCIPSTIPRHPGQPKHNNIADLVEFEKGRKYFVGTDVSATSKYYHKVLDSSLSDPSERTSIRYINKVDSN